MALFSLGRVSTKRSLLGTDDNFAIEFDSPFFSSVMCNLVLQLGAPSLVKLTMKNFPRQDLCHLTTFILKSYGLHPT